MRTRIFRRITTYLHAVGGVVIVTMVLSPKWGTPGDFYLGYPKRFYVTQYDAGEYFNIPVLLLDLAVVGIPALAVVLLLQWGLARLLFRRN